MKLHCTAIALALTLTASLASGSSIGVFFDAAGSRSMGTIAPNTSVTLYVVACLDGPEAANFHAAKYRIAGVPSGWFVNVSPNPAVDIAFGNVLTGGQAIAFPSCQQAGRVLLSTIQGFATTAPPDLTIQVPARTPPGDPAFACPVVAMCDHPDFTMTCVVGGKATFNGPCNPPEIVTFSPQTGPGGTSVFLNGSYFDQTTSVHFRGSSCNFILHSATQIEVTLPASTVPGAIRVTTPCGIDSTETSFVPTDVAQTILPSSPVAVWPNPFGREMQIGFSVPMRTPVSMDVFNVAGRRVRSWSEVGRGPGRLIHVWDGRGEDGRAQPAGVYYVRIRWPGYEATRWVTKAP